MPRFSGIVFLILFFVGIITQYSFAQAEENTGYVHLKIYGVSKPLCRVDTSAVRVNDTLLNLSPGEHTVKIWMPTMLLVDSVITIKTNDTVKYSFSIKRNPAYVKYATDYFNYKQLRNKRFAVSPILIGLTTGSAIVIDKFVATKYYDNAIRSKELYSKASSQTLIDEYRDDFEMYKKKYKTTVYVEYGLYSLAGVLVANYVRVLIKQRRTPVPFYKEEKLLSSIKFNMYPDFKSQSCMIGFNMGF